MLDEEDEREEDDRLNRHGQAAASVVFECLFWLSKIIIK